MGVGAAAGHLTNLTVPNVAGYPALVNQDSNGAAAVPVEQWIKNGNGLYVPVSTTHPLPPQTAPSGVLYDGSLTVATAAAVLAPSQTCSEVLVQADPGNTKDIRVGNATSQSIVLQAGQSESLQVNNVNLIYVAAVSGSQKVNYHARS